MLVLHRRGPHQHLAMSVVADIVHVVLSNNFPHMLLSHDFSCI